MTNIDNPTTSIMLKELIISGAIILPASVLQASTGSNETSPQGTTRGWSTEYYKTTCGKFFWGATQDMFNTPAEYEEYKREMNYLHCGTHDMPETWERPTPSTEPDPH